MGKGLGCEKIKLKRDPAGWRDPFSNVTNPGIKFGLET